MDEENIVLDWATLVQAAEKGEPEVTPTYEFSARTFTRIGPIDYEA